MTNRKLLSRRERAAYRMERIAARARAAAPEQPPDDVDQMRYWLARRIAVFIGNRKQYWRGCAEPCCRRARACIAPRIACSNGPKQKPDPDGRRWARTSAHIQRTLRHAAEQRAAQEGR